MFNGNILRDAIISGANNIANQKKAVDDLNVFPVPDGDTGTNMSMSIGNAARELARIDGETVGEVAKIAASALLRGARGNSGVITSLLFRGFSKGFKGAQEITPENLTDAFKLGVEAAYKAVMKPTEGTILTVSRVASEYAENAFNEGKDTLEVFAAALQGAKEALAQTPEMLPVLKKAGVVDAGGQGFVVILEGMYSVLKDGVMIELSNAAPEQQEESSQPTVRNAAGELEEFDINFPYCTEFIVNRAEDCDKEPSELRSYLESIGDCVVVVDDEEIIKVHVHTDHPGNAIEKALTFGALVKLKIENMAEQHEQAKKEAKKTAQNADRTEPIKSVAPEKSFGFVSVAAGEGLATLFADLGADIVVSGGQTMNPSTDDILRAVESTPAETVFVFPNNKNIIMAAEQTIRLATRNVIVIHTRTIPQGITAMLNFDPDASANDNAIAMNNAINQVGTGQITFAARDSEFDGKKIKEGELLALNNGKITFTETSLEACLVKLTKQLLKKDSAYVTLFYGEDVSERKAQTLYNVIQEKFGSKVEVTLVNGGQPVYYFIISVE
ncbi:MAG: DAK2 domain-containing protein [Ruminococcaceae bacterium]|nr:DAK2 domain-containing protein [Oscillospiraceae bacterium]